MDSRFQSSFIPKKPVDTGSLRPSGDVNIFLIVTILIFIITGAAAGGVFFYKTTLQKQSEEKDAELISVKKSFGLEDIQTLKNRVRQLEAVKIILNKHLTATPLFHLIESNTLKNVRFTSFSYTNKDNKASITLSGEARTFNSVAYQSQVFTDLGEFTSPSFSGFNLVDTGNVSFNFTSSLRPDLLNYNKHIDVVPESESDLPDTSGGIQEGSGGIR